MLFKKLKSKQASNNIATSSLFLDPFEFDGIGLRFDDILDLYFYEDKLLMLLKEDDEKLSVVSLKEGNLEKLISMPKPRFESFWPILRVTSDGNFIIVNTRCRRVSDTKIERNALIYDNAGRVLNSFTLGDGITDVVPLENSLLVGYFDEGVFGNYGWDTPIGKSGLVTFDLNGNILTEYSAFSKNEYIYDVYCMNKVSDNDVWMYFYGPENYLFKLNELKRIKYVLRYVSGIHGFSIYENTILTTSGYERSNRYYLGNIERGELLKVIELFDSVDKEVIVPKRTYSFNDKLFLVTEKNLYVISVSEAS